MGFDGVQLTDSIDTGQKGGDWEFWLLMSGLEMG